MSPTQLPFPLNVYAQTLVLEFGEARHLHFALYDKPGAQSFVEAQLAAEDALCALLPPPPAQVMEVGCGSGALAHRLSDAGYTVLALTPLESEYAQLRENRQENFQVELTDLPSQAVAQPVDVLILQQSAQYLPPLELFARAALQLREGGVLLLADEFTLDDSQRRREPRPVLAHFLRLAQRCGFVSARQRELGRQVAPGLQEFARLLQRHRDSLLAQGLVTQAQLSQLQEDLQRMAVQYASAHLGYTLLDLRREAITPEQPVLGDIHSFAGGEVSRLFECSFETPFDADIWQWKYGEGRGRAVCARLGTELIAHYGGAPRDILYFGEPEKAIQICDVMVMPEHRSFVSRDTLFFKLAATFLELEVGNCAEHLLGVGFPNMRVLRVARRLGLYDITDSFVEIDYDGVDVKSLEGLQQGLEVRPFALEDEAEAVHIDRLWTDMAVQMQDRIVGLRDSAYWQYRYVSHPAWSRGLYRALAVCAPHSTQPLVVVLLRAHEGVQLLMDLVGAPQHFSAAVAAVRTFLARESQLLRCRVTQAQASLLSLPGSRQVDLGIEIPCNIWTRGPDTATLRGAWWLTAGDMDFL